MSSFNFSFFLLAFPALLSIVNPLGGAFLFLANTRRLPPTERVNLARWVALYGFIILNVSLFIGAWVLGFFGISLPVLRVAGGIIITIAGYKMLNAEEETHAGDEVPDLPRNYSASKAAFYPLTLPLTTGPGSIAVAVSMGTGRPRGAFSEAFWTFFLQAMLTTVLICGIIFVCYRYADRLERNLGPTGSTIVMRLTAFLLFCIGIEVLWSGISELLETLRTV